MFLRQSDSSRYVELHHYFHVYSATQSNGNFNTVKLGLKINKLKVPIFKFWTKLLFNTYSVEVAESPCRKENILGTQARSVRYVTRHQALV